MIHRLHKPILTLSILFLLVGVAYSQFAIRKRTNFPTPVFSQSSPLNIDADENQTSVTTVNASTAAGGSLEYSLSGTDASLFTIGARTGIITFNDPPDYELPDDANQDNVYEFIASATLGETEPITVNVTVLDVDEEVEIIGATITNPATNPYNVNVAGGTTAVVDVNATGDEPIVYSISGGADSAFFVINDTTGELTFASAPTDGANADANGDDTYEVIVSADNGVADTVQINATVVAPAVAPPNLAGGSPRLLLIYENTSLIENATATNGPITWSISGGPDADVVQVNSSGVVTFINPADHETPLTASGSNKYEFDLRATNSVSFDDDTIQVIVADVADTGECDINSPYYSTLTTNVPENVTIAFRCRAVVDGTATWTITGGADAADFSIDSAGLLTFNTPPDFENPHDADTDNIYVVTVNADNGTNSDSSTLTIHVNDLSEGNLLFSDLTAGAKTGWSASEPNKGVAVTVWTYDLGTGTTRGTNFVTVNGEDLTDAGDYAEWNVPHFDTTNDPDMRNIYRTTFWINSNCADGDGTITVTVGGNESNAIPFRVLTGDILFVDKDHGGTDAGTFENPYQTLNATRVANSSPGDVFYVREATTPYTGYDIYLGGSSIANYYTELTTMDATEAAPCAFVSYPAETAHMQAAPSVYPTNPAGIKRGFFQVAPWWTIAKFRIETDNASCSLYGNGSRCVGNDCTGDLISTAAGVIGTNGSKHKVLGNTVHGGRSGDKLDHGLYASGNASDTLGVQVAWNYMYDNNWGEGPMMVLNHQEERIPSPNHCKMHLVHDNYVNCEDFPGRAIGCYQVGWEVGNPFHEEQPETHYVFNNVTVGANNCCYVYAGNVNLWNNSFVECVTAGLDLGHTAVIWTDVRNNIVTMASGTSFIGINSTLSPFDVLVATNNLYYAGGSGSAPALDTNPVFANPLLTNTYGLGASSPAIDAGSSITPGFIFRDFDNQPRDDGNIDIGAWEAQ